MPAPAPAAAATPSSYGTTSQMPDSTVTSPYANNSRPSSGYFPDDRAAASNHNTVANAHEYSALPLSNSLPAGDNPLSASQSANGRFTEEWDASQRGSSLLDGGAAGSRNMHRTSSYMSNAGPDELHLPSRSNTLKKKASLRRSASLKRSSSRRSMRAGSVRSLALQSSSDPDEAHSAFFCPVPTSGNPTDVLANRFQGEFESELVYRFRQGGKRNARCKT